MKRTFFLAIGLLVCFTGAAQAIGLQHGLFRSQSTQGEVWTGTAEITQETYRITVFPDYLDVELEWVFEVGGTEPDSFTNALEVVGNINFEDNSVVVGMLTWYKDMTLKGKLKTADDARAQYEEVVERDSDAPPPPRDPVLLEWIRDDNYDISVFPISWGGSRKVRIRYLVPAKNVNGVAKIAYPHAFTNHAEVTVKAGPGVSGYSIETSTIVQPIETPSPIALDNTKYSFAPYGSSRALPVPRYIVPALSVETEGSRLYIGEFSTPGFAGQMAHLTTMTASKAIAKTAVAEDYVVIWRWNHPEILARYARQIVEQSRALKAFCESIDAANKRVALIIDKQGGEQISFALGDKQSGSYDEIIAYLDELAQTPIIDPPVKAGGTGKPEPEIDLAQAKAEFEAALEAAVELFEEDAARLQHILILTAGPRLINDYSDATPEWNRDIDVAPFSSFCPSRPDISPPSLYDLYWPGVNVLQFISENRKQLRAYAALTNGTDSAKAFVRDMNNSYSYWQTCRPTNELHVFSKQSLHHEIAWQIYQGDKLLGSFTETPSVVQMSEGLQFARLVGASPFLEPLAESMPTSLAAALGFIDEKYSLVALEEDALDQTVASQFEDIGVPTLAAADIFPAAEEHSDQPIAQWLEQNPIPPWCEQYGWFYFMPVTMDGALENTTARDHAAKNNGRMINQQAQTIANIDDANAEPDYSESAIAVLKPSNAKQTLSCTVQNGVLLIDLTQLSRSQRANLHTIELVDVSGRVIARWRVTESNMLRIRLASVISRGVYVLRYSLSEKSVRERIVVR